MCSAGIYFLLITESPQHPEALWNIKMPKTEVSIIRLHSQMTLLSSVTWSYSLGTITLPVFNLYLLYKMGQFWSMRDTRLLLPQPVSTPTCPSHNGILVSQVCISGTMQPKHKQSPSSGASPNKQQSVFTAEEKQPCHPETVCLHVAFIGNGRDIQG